MKKEIDNELHEISPFLADLKKGMQEDKEPFRVPKFYFDTLADKVLEKAQPTPITTPQYEAQLSLSERLQSWISLLLKPRYAMSLATVLILAIGGFWFFNNKTIINVNGATELTEISNEEIHQYINENIDDFEEQILQAHESIADTEGAETINVSEDEINEYLKDNIDESDLKNIENDL